MVFHSFTRNGVKTQRIGKSDMEECIAIVCYHSFPSAVMVILILCKVYGYYEYHLYPVQPDHSCESDTSFGYLR